MPQTRMDPSGRAFEDFYGDVQPRLLAALVAFSGDVDLAAEAVDEAFVRALVHWPRVGSMASPAGWVYRVAVNVARRQAQRRDRERATAHRLASNEGLTAPEARPGGLGIEVRELVGQLPDRQRLAVVLRYVGDLPEADIARVMGIRRSTVSATLGKARANLQRHLTEQSGTPATNLLAQPDAGTDRAAWEPS
jgi:RNA polymerase sigma factor (sigma-70 family)